MATYVRRILNSLRRRPQLLRVAMALCILVMGVSGIWIIRPSQRAHATSTTTKLLLVHGFDDTCEYAFNRIGNAGQPYTAYGFLKDNGWSDGATGTSTIDRVGYYNPTQQISFLDSGGNPIITYDARTSDSPAGYCDSNLVEYNNGNNDPKICDNPTLMGPDDYFLDDPIPHIACVFAWYVYDTYTLHDIAVDILAHSMGGLIVRYAIGESGHGSCDASYCNGYFPHERLMVSRVVTVATPHGGQTGFYLDQAQSRFPENGFSAVREVRDMDPTSTGDGFMHDIGFIQAPQGSTGTYWALMAGSVNGYGACYSTVTANISCGAENYPGETNPYEDGDGVVQADSQLSMAADFKILYGEGTCLKCNLDGVSSIYYYADKNDVSVPDMPYSHEANACDFGPLHIAGCLSPPFYLNDGTPASQTTYAWICSSAANPCPDTGGITDLKVVVNGRGQSGRPALHSLAEIAALLSPPTIGAASVTTGSNPWQVSVTGSNFTSTLVARLTDGGQQWGGDIPVTFHDPGSVTFPLPSNKAPDFCNSTAPCTIQLRLYDTVSDIPSDPVPLTLPAYAYAITGDGVSTSYNPWAVWVTGPYFTRTLVARLTDVNGQRWGGDIPTVYGNSFISFSLPGNTPPSGCNINTSCAISLILYDTADGASSNSASLTLPASPIVVVNVTGGGQFYTKWQQYGGASGALGNPVENWNAINGGQQQHFAGTSCGAASGSAIYWSSATGTYEVDGCIFQKYTGIGGPTSALGFPTSNEFLLFFPATGAMNTFQNGTIWWSSATGTWFTFSGINAKYTSMGGPISVLGFPTSDEQYAAGGAFNTFQNGGIYWSGSTSAHEVDGPIAGKYISMGGPNSGLGFPRTDVNPIAGGYESDLQSGSLYYYSPATGAHFTYGGINAMYHSMGGPSSWLGFPISDEHGTTVVANGRESDFQYGYIVWDFSTGQATAYQYNLPCPPGQPC